jgi:hypothetical protein
VAEIDPQMVAMADLLANADAMVPPPDTTYPVPVAEAYYQAAAYAASGEKTAAEALVWLDETVDGDGHAVVARATGRRRGSPPEARTFCSRFPALAALRHLRSAAACSPSGLRLRAWNGFTAPEFVGLEQFPARLSRHGASLRPTVT